MALLWHGEGILKVEEEQQDGGEDTPGEITCHGGLTLPARGMVEGRDGG